MDKLSQFKHLLHEGKVLFAYTKANGETRKALGTLNSAFLPKRSILEEESMKPTRKHSADVVVYYDLEKRAFRSFKACNFIGCMPFEK